MLIKIVIGSVRMIRIFSMMCSMVGKVEWKVISIEIRMTKMIIRIFMMIIKLAKMAIRIFWSVISLVRIVNRCCMMGRMIFRDVKIIVIDFKQMEFVQPIM